VSQDDKAMLQDLRDLEDELRGIEPLPRRKQMRKSTQQRLLALGRAPLYEFDNQRKWIREIVPEPEPAPVDGNETIRLPILPRIELGIPSGYDAIDWTMNNAVENIRRAGYPVPRIAKREQVDRYGCFRDKHNNIIGIAGSIL